MMSGRITAWTWGTTALVVLAAAWLGARAVHSRVLDEFGGSERAGSSLLAERLAGRLERGAAAAELLARSRDRSQALLAEVQRQNPNLARLAVCEGGLILSRGLELPQLRLRARTWTRVPLAGTELAVYRIPLEGEDYVEVALANEGTLRDDHGPCDLVVDREGNVVLGSCPGNLCRLLPALPGPTNGPFG